MWRRTLVAELTGIWATLTVRLRFDQNDTSYVCPLRLRVLGECPSKGGG